MSTSKEVVSSEVRTATERLVADVYSLDLASLSPEVVAHVKRVVVDCVACAVGGAGSPPAIAVESVVAQLGGRPEATVIGSGTRTSSVLASLANGTMLRYLDYMDTVLVESPAGAVSATHPSEVVMPLLATAEANRCSGRQLIEAIALAYELAVVLCRTLEAVPLRNLGWHHATLAPYILPVTVARLCGAPPAQAVTATGLAGLHNIVLNIVDADDEEPTSARSVVYPLVAANCLVDVALARAGIGGVPRILEGSGGFAEVVGRRSWPVEGIRPDARCEGVLTVWTKPAVACVLGQGATAALLELVAEDRISAGDVDRVRVRVKPAALAHMGGEIQRFPTSKETADHSLYFLSALAIRDGVIGPAQFTALNYEDQQIKALIERVEVGVLDAKPADSVAAAAVTIRTRDGVLHERSVGIPPGHPERPFTDIDAERKLRQCARGRLSDAQLDHFLEAVGHLDSIEDVGDLLRPLTFST